MIETRSSKPLRSEIQLLSQLCWDDTPEMDITSVRFSRDWFHRTSTVLRNAYVLCGMCHLQVFKAFDSKVAEHCFVQLDNELGLRHVVAQEFFSADKKIWHAIQTLYSQGTWSFEECLHEMTVVRSDISSLLQPRPRIPKALPPPTGKGKGHKGKGKGQKGQGKGGKTPLYAEPRSEGSQRIHLTRGYFRRRPDTTTITTLSGHLTIRRILQSTSTYRIHFNFIDSNFTCYIFTAQPGPRTFHSISRPHSDRI